MGAVFNASVASIGAVETTLRWSPPMRKPKRHKPLNDLNRSHTPLDVNRTLIAVVELSGPPKASQP